jgi:secretion/DNA translocation related TadE-like protein
VSDHGFASVVLIALLALAALVCIAMSDAANVVLARARAQAAADAAALSAAQVQWRTSSRADPREAAAQTATANGAALESCECPVRGASSIVVVSRPTRIRMLGGAPRSVSARAEATMDPGRMFAN